MRRIGIRRRMRKRKQRCHALLRFGTDTFDRTANACFKDAADLHADLEEYPQAIARYEQVADGSLASPLTKYSVKEYWLRASLCALAMQVRSHSC